MKHLLSLLFVVLTTILAWAQDYPAPIISVEDGGTVERGTPIIITKPEGALFMSYAVALSGEAIDNDDLIDTQEDQVTISTDEWEGGTHLWIKAHAYFTDGMGTSYAYFTVHDAFKLYEVEYIYDGEQGTVEGPVQAMENDIVTFSVTPADGFDLNKVEVTDDLYLHFDQFTDNGDGTFTFTMPDRTTCVRVTFKPSSTVTGNTLTVTFTAGVDKGTQTGGNNDQVSKDGVTLSTVGSPLGNSDNYRIYKNKSLTISTSQGTISRILFTSTAAKGKTYGPDLITPDVGAYSTSDGSKEGIWGGEAESITFTASAQARFTSIVVIVTLPDDGNVTAPVITGTTPFKESTLVTIEAQADAEVRYTLDGNDPTEDSTPYESPFTLTQTATVKAIAIVGDKSSNVAERTFTALPGVPSIARFNALPDNTPFYFTCPLVAVAQTGSYLYAQDENGALGMLIYGDAKQTYNLGDIIPAGAIGIKTTFKGAPEMTDPSDFLAADGHQDVEPAVLTPMQVNIDNFGRYAVVKGVTIDGTTLIAGEESVALYNRFGWVAPDDLEKQYDIIGVVGYYNVPQFMPLSHSEAAGPALRGDVNGDNVVSGSDVTALYNVLLNGDTAAGNADVNSDGIINGSDVTALYTILLEQ